MCLVLATTSISEYDRIGSIDDFGSNPSKAFGSHIQTHTSIDSTYSHTAILGFTYESTQRN